MVVSREVLDDLLPGPVTVVGERSAELNPLLNPGTSLVGIRIPDHTFIRRLAQACNSPLALTSANRSSAQSTLTLDVSDEGGGLESIIIIMEICKVPTLRLKALNKHTHIMYIEMENVIKLKKKRKDIDITMQKMHTHTHTVQTGRSEGQCG